MANSGRRWASRRALACVAAALVTGARADSPAAPVACPESVANWQLGRGELVADNACGAFLLTTDAEDHEASLGEASFKRTVHLPYAMSVRVRRVGPESGRPMWIGVLGAVVFFRDGAVGVGQNAAPLADTADQALPGFDTHQEHLIAVAQSRRSIEVRVDGALVRTIPLASALTSGALALGINGARGYRSSMAFRDFALGEPAQ